jgi:hypothetical protein
VRADGTKIRLNGTSFGLTEALSFIRRKVVPGAELHADESGA